MENIEIKKETIEYALELLDIQYDHIRKEKKGIPQNRQEAYYNGMHEMLEMILTQAFTDNSIQVSHDCYFNHFIKQNNA